METRGPAILVVDDDPAVRELFESFLTLRGYAVHTAADGVAALRQLERERPQLILLDHHLPGRTGLAVLRQLRAAGSTIPVILISGALDVETRKAAQALGALACLDKPVGLLDLERCLTAFAMGRAAA